MTALHVECVAKPQETHRVRSAIPAVLSEALQDVSGFAGCLLMISEQEARLVTVIVLWVGNERLKHCRDNARRIHTMLARYVDRCVRVQTLAAHLPAQAETGLEMDVEDDYSMERSLDETACVA